MKKNLFLAATPYHIFNILNIIEEKFKYYENHIMFINKSIFKYKYILENNSNIKIIFYENIFEKKFNIKSFQKVKYFIDILISSFRIKFVLSDEYENFFIFNRYIDPSIFSYCHKINKNIKVCAYEDGFATYMKNYFEDYSIPHLYHEFMKKLYSSGFFWDRVDCIYCYLPQYLEILSKNIQVYRIKTNKLVEEKFSNISSMELIKKYNNSKFIFLDQGNVEKSKEILKMFFGEFNKFFEKNEIIIKKHPRLDFIYNDNEFEMDNSGIPFESIIFNNIYMDNKVLISMFSTACFTPYILKNKKPYIIFLGSLYTDIWNFQWETSYFKNLLNSYGVDKIFIPKDINELQTIFENLKLLND